MEIKAIETEYHGHLFRSRLEARWAVFFDACGIKWQYEPQGFEVGNFRYLPDFYLPLTQTWVEVKGDPQGLRQEWQRMASILDHNSPLPGFSNSGIDPDENFCRGLLVLGEIPYVKWGRVFHPLIQHHEGLLRTYAMFNEPWGGVVCAERVHDESLRAVEWFTGATMQAENLLETEPTHWDVKPVIHECRWAFPRVIKAYESARQARFEHGETPQFKVA